MRLFLSHPFMNSKERRNTSVAVLYAQHAAYPMAKSILQKGYGSASAPEE